MIAEYERAQIAERSRRGKRHRAKLGCVNVLSAAPYAYRYVRKCGYSLYRTSTRTSKHQARYDRCLGSDGYGHLKDPPCACRPIRVEDLDELVWGQVSDLLEKPELIRAELERRRQESLKNDPARIYG